MQSEAAATVASEIRWFLDNGHSPKNVSLWCEVSIRKVRSIRRLPASDVGRFSGKGRKRRDGTHAVQRRYMTVDFLPTPEQIEQAAAEIRKTWGPEDIEERATDDSPMAFAIPVMQSVK